MFGDRLDETLARGRAAAEARMRSTARVRRNNGLTTGPDGWDVVAWLDVYTGPLRLAGADSGSSPSRTKTVGGVEYQAATRVAHFPHDTSVLRDGDVLEITEGESAGLFFVLLEVDPADQQTALRVPVEATQKPKDW